MDRGGWRCGTREGWRDATRCEMHCAFITSMRSLDWSCIQAASSEDPQTPGEIFVIWIVVPGHNMRCHGIPTCQPTIRRVLVVKFQRRACYRLPEYLEIFNGDDLLCCYLVLTPTLCMLHAVPTNSQKTPRIQIQSIITVTFPHPPTPGNRLHTSLPAAWSDEVMACAQSLRIRNTSPMRSWSPQCPR